MRERVVHRPCGSFLLLEVLEMFGRVPTLEAQLVFVRAEFVKKQSADRRTIIWM